MSKSSVARLAPKPEPAAATPASAPVPLTDLAVVVAPSGTDEPRRHSGLDVARWLAVADHWNPGWANGLSAEEHATTLHGLSDLVFHAAASSSSVDDDSLYALSNLMELLAALLLASSETPASLARYRVEFSPPAAGARRPLTAAERTAVTTPRTEADRLLAKADRLRTKLTARAAGAR